MSNIITLYDMDGKTPGRSWAPYPSTLCARYCLTYKGLAYDVVWVEFSDIEQVCKKIGALHTRLEADGRPKYTLPVIYDPSTGATVSDTFRIAAYLDATYPETPRLIPEGTNALQKAFTEVYTPFLTTAAQFLLPKSALLISPSCVENFNYIKGTVEFGKPMDEVMPKGEMYKAEWQKLNRILAVVAGFLEAGKLEGPFVMGQTVSFADFFFGGLLVWMKAAWGEDSAEWNDLTSWHGGRWGALVKALEKYRVVST